jgi:hypothetical protein
MTIKLVANKTGRKMIERASGTSYNPSAKPVTKIEKKRKLSLEEELIKAYEDNKPRNLPEDYQHPKGKTFVIYDETATEIFRCVGSIPAKKLKKLNSRYPKAVVMVDLGKNLFQMVPLKTFKKLTKIKFISFEREYEFFGLDEDERFSKAGEWFTPNAIIDSIYSINQLLKMFVIEEAFDRANSVYLSARFYDLTGCTKVCKIMYRSGRVEEMKYHDFVEKYMLNLSLSGIMTPKEEANQDRKDAKAEKKAKKDKKHGKKKKK